MVVTTVCWEALASDLFSVYNHPYELLGSKKEEILSGMPKSAQYSLKWSPEQAGYILTETDTGMSFLLDDTGTDWQKWLSKHRSFAFHGQCGRLNVLKEQRQRGECYWYAYQRRSKGMAKRYIGPGDQVRVAFLEEIVTRFSDNARTLSVSSGTSPAEQHSHEKRAISEMPVLDQSGHISSTRASAPALHFEPLLLSKIQFPRAHSALLPRPHLWELLDKGLEYKLTLISCPAGYGKTTLVGQWVTVRGGRADFPRVAYVTLDEGDNDPLRFWSYVIAAYQSFQTDFGREALELLRAHRLPPFKPLEMMLVVLLNELSHLEYPTLLVLDDVHALDSPQVIDSLNFFLEHLPASSHLIMLIRGDPPFSLVRQQAHNEVMDIYPPNLGFTLEETRAFFEQELSFPLSQKIVRQIYERMDAWPAGLRLLARELDVFTNAEDIELMLSSFTGDHWGVREYFLSEVMHTLPADLQTFVLQTSLLPRLNASLCQAITGREDSAQLLTALRAGDRFIIPLDRKGEWSRYQTLFAQAMQEEAHTYLGDEQIRQQAYRASIWYEDHALLDEAIETALDAHAFARAASLMERFVIAREQNNISTVPELYSMKRWMERLPREDLEHSPELCLHYALVRLFILVERFRVPEGDTHIQHLLQVAEAHWREANNTARLGSVFAFRALLARQEGHLLQAVSWARQSLAWLPLDERVWRTLSLTVVGHGELLEGNLDQARALFLESLVLSDRQGNQTYARATRGMLAGVSIEYGELHHAAEQFHQIQAEARIQEDYDDIAHAQLGLAQLAYQWNRLDEAEQAAQEALTIGEQFHQEEFLAYASIHLARIEHARGNSFQARQRLNSWLARHPTPLSPFSFQLSREVQATLVRIQLATGEHTSAEHWFTSIEGSAVKLPLLQQQREQLLYAHLLQARQQISSAVSLLEELYTSAIQTRHIGFSLEVQVQLAQAYARQGFLEKARAQLYGLLVASLREGYVRLFLDEGEELASMLRGLLPSLQEKSLLARARYLLAAFNVSTSLPVVSVLNEPLSSQERKVLRLLAAGHSNASIARELVVSVNTVRTQLQSIYRKLNVNNRVEASAMASQLELL
jgi:LuxR family maltose regulon positive regulatory protein